MNIETERKFLVADDSFKSEAVRTLRIKQGYIAHDAGRTVRVRIADDKGFLTIKGPSTDNGLSRFEWEKEIALDEARELLSLCGTDVIDKWRHIVPFGGHTFEVDEFLGDNAGLIVAEVEMGSTDEVVSLPEWIREEVTSDRRYRNSALCSLPFKDWK